MSKEDVIDYVMTTPSNPNKAVLSGMLDSIADASSGGGGDNNVGAICVPLAYAPITITQKGSYSPITVAFPMDIDVAVGDEFTVSESHSKGLNSTMWTATAREGGFMEATNAVKATVNIGSVVKADDALLDTMDFYIGGNNKLTTLAGIKSLFVNSSTGTDSELVVTVVKGKFK